MFEQKDINSVLGELSCDSNAGLTSAQVSARLEKDGENVLTAKKQKTKLQMFWAQLNEPMIYILFAAAAISLFLSEIEDAVIILLVVLLNAVIGVVQEGKAQQALEALKKLSSPTALVRRDGVVSEIDASKLVVGDVVLLEAGRQVPADLRLIFSSNLKIEESALTGESVPVDKDSNFVAKGDVPLGDKINMAFMTTAVSYGRGEGVVVATGMKTEIGKIAQMINESQDELTPLQKRLADLGKLLGVLAIVICALLFGIAVLQQRDVVEMLITAISLAVAAVPEGLPAIVTIVLALGVSRMVRVNAIVRRLPSVETLGSVSVVCSDKTGTLTQNKMTVVSCYMDGKVLEVSELKPEANCHFLNGFVICNDASINNDSRIGDPTELALLDMGKTLGITREGLEEQMPRTGELSFDSDRKMMTTLHNAKSGNVAYTKGAADSIIKRCINIFENGQTRPITENDREKISAVISQMSSKALRVLALAIKENSETLSEEDLTFVGLVGMIDPPRPEAKDAVTIFKGASVKTVMITGDHRDTAFAIAKQLGIAEDISECITGEDLDSMTQEELNERADSLCVFARVSPEHKVMVVNAYKSRGYIVSMTGDGVNDAPSLKAADIGVAMGITGTDVAKGAADMVLADDNFATIEKAIEEGRGIYANIKKSVLFLLSSNFGEIITMFLSILVGLAAPLKATHILWVNLITDSLPGLALGVDTNDSRDIMRHPPRNPKESLFAEGGLAITLFYGTLVAFITLTGFIFIPLQMLVTSGMQISIENIANCFSDPSVLIRSQTYAFTVLGLSQLFHAVGMRNIDKSLFAMDHLANRLMLVAFVLGFVLQIAVTEIPILMDMFSTAQLSLNEWVMLTALSSAPAWAHELIVAGKAIKRRLKSQRV